MIRIWFVTSHHYKTASRRCKTTPGLIFFQNNCFTPSYIRLPRHLAIHWETTQNQSGSSLPVSQKLTATSKIKRRRMKRSLLLDVSWFNSVLFDIRGAAENGAGSPLDKRLHIQGAPNCRAFQLFPCCPSPQAITSPTKSVLLNLCNNSPSPLFRARKQKNLSQVKMDAKPLLGYNILKPCCSSASQAKPTELWSPLYFHRYTDQLIPFTSFLKIQFFFFLFIFTLSHLFSF